MVFEVVASFFLCLSTTDNGTNVPEVFTEHRLNPVYATIDGPLRRAAASVLAWPSRHLVYAGRSLLSGTSSKQANYGHLLGARPTDLAFELRNMLPASLSQAPYDTLKTILERTAMCERRWLKCSCHQQSSAIPVHPSSSDKCKLFFGARVSSFDEVLLKPLIIQRLPHKMQMVLTTTL